MSGVIPSWHRLRISALPKCPQVFYKFKASRKGIDLYVTDTTAIWEFSMTRQEATAYAKENSCSIDPSASPSQWDVLTQKLQQALAEGSKKLLTCPSSSSVRQKNLVLRTNLKLPKPLRSLKWSFPLTLQGSGRLAQQTLWPCLRDIWLYTRKVGSLTNIIKTKDHVISKLLDKMEGSTDMSLIFPGITGLKSRRGRITVEEAKRHVAGMAEFDSSEWMARFQSDSESRDDDEGSDQGEMDSLVTTYDKCPQFTLKEHEDWLDHLPEERDDASFSFSSLPVHDQKEEREVKSATNKGQDEDDDEDFERQSTPPSLRNRPVKRSIEATSSPAKEIKFSAEQERPRPAKMAKLGALGSLKRKHHSLVDTTPSTHSSSRSIQGLAENASITAESDKGAENDSSPEPTEKHATHLSSSHHHRSSLSGDHSTASTQSPESEPSTRWTKQKKPDIEHVPINRTSRPGRLKLRHDLTESQSKNGDGAEDTGDLPLAQKRDFNTSSRSISTETKPEPSGGTTIVETVLDAGAGTETETETETEAEVETEVGTHREEKFRPPPPQISQPVKPLSNEAEEGGGSGGGGGGIKRKIGALKKPIKPQSSPVKPNNDGDTDTDTDNEHGIHAHTYTHNHNHHYDSSSSGSSHIVNTVNPEKPSPTTAPRSDSSQSTHTDKHITAAPAAPVTIHGRAQDSKDQSGEGPDPKPEIQTEPVRQETTEERANRRRIALQKSLGPATGGGRKKRKF